jgi:hypothetical protein
MQHRPARRASGHRRRRLDPIWLNSTVVSRWLRRTVARQHLWMQTTGACMVARSRRSVVGLLATAHDSRSACWLLYLAAVRLSAWKLACHAPT